MCIATPLKFTKNNMATAGVLTMSLIPYCSSKHQTLKSEVLKYYAGGFVCLLVIFLYITADSRKLQNRSKWQSGSSFQHQNVSGFKSYIARNHSTYETKKVVVPSDFVPADDTKLLSFQCIETFNKTLEENLNVIKNYPRGIADRYLLQLGINKTGPDQLRTFPVFATAFEYRYYFVAQGLFKSIHERFLVNPKHEKDVHIIVYDLGMTGLQYSKVKRNCKCEIRRFPFEKFPPHVMELKTYAFKPIIVQMLLMEFGFVWWMDSSIRFMTSDIDSAVAYAKNYSILHTVSTNDRNACAMTKHTDTATFEFLREDRCKFRPFAEVWATTVMFHFDRVSRVAVEAWATCALNKNCIAPTGSDKKLTCDYKKDYDGRCHRFDQSVLGIITRRIFHEQNRYPLDNSLNDIYQIRRGEITPYFV